MLIKRRDFVFLDIIMANFSKKNCVWNTKGTTKVRKVEDRVVGVLFGLATGDRIGGPVRMALEVAAIQVDKMKDGRTAGCNPAHRSAPLSMLAIISTLISGIS